LAALRCRGRPRAVVGGHTREPVPMTGLVFWLAIVALVLLILVLAVTR
jgi:hypothetical protein